MSNYLIFGNGWIGNKFKTSLEHAEISLANIVDSTAVENDIDKYKPLVVINCAGKTGRPNIDWCEDHQGETYASNVDGPINLAKICQKRNLLLAHISSGCIYEGDNKGKGYSEEDPPNYFGSYYSMTKVMAEQALKDKPVLLLRLRMPVDKQPSERNLITKIAGYKQIINVSNSISIIDDFIYASKCLIEKNKVGIYNITNPGAIGHAEILRLYTQYVDPSHKFEIITNEQLKKLTKAGRSNCILNTDKLQKEGITLPDINEAIKACLKQYKPTY